MGLTAAEHRVPSSALLDGPSARVGDDAVFTDGAPDCASGGTEAELLAAAVRANASHGLPLARVDREAAAARMIEVLPRHSDRWIASLTGLAPGTIASLRGAQGAEACGATRVGRDGRKRPVDIASRRRA